MPKSEIEKKYPEVKEIKHDIDSLKSNTIELGKHIKEDGAAKTEQLKEVASNRLHALADQGKDQLKNIESRVKEKPLQSMAIAFAAGLAVSVFMGRR